MKFVLLFVCAASGFWWPLSSAEANSAHATHVNIPIDGTIDSNGCRIIGGEIVTDTIDYIEPSRSIELCNYNDKYHFKIVTYSLCVAAIGYWTDPETGFTYTFSSICSAPRFYTEISCNGGEAQIVTKEKPFYVLLDTTNSSCNSFDFNKAEKKITMVVNVHNQHNRMNVTIPSELLSGEFSLLIDRGSTENFLVNDAQGYTTVSFSKFCPNNCNYQVDIIGTEVTASELERYSSLPIDSTPRPLFMNAKGERIEQPEVSHQVVIFGNYHNQNQEAQPYIMLFEFRTAGGVTEFIAWQTGTAEPDSFATAGVSWVPEIRGEHEVRIFIISDLENPIVLSPVYSYGVFVV